MAWAPGWLAHNKSLALVAARGGGWEHGRPGCAWAGRDGIGPAGMGLDGIGGICQYWSQDFICRSSRDMEQKALMKAVARRVLVKSGTL